ncbi:unnamed protein product [Angiostrongylus costaricensis]|uniref:ANK_REP_REGION domain-containing protein n=1 Tax=Angiostrongylus costaricensis TaxID=334426 RepID=A0A158PML0_ANGCS|nr:unnamed protein product [Angiostrongylus costaricensis]
MKRSLANELRDPISVVSILIRNMNRQQVKKPQIFQIDYADCDGNTALHLSAFKDANISAEGNSPLAVAVLYGRRSVALTLIQADSNVSDQVFYPQKAEVKTDVWKWNGIQESSEKPTVSTVPAVIISQGGEWEAIVYVLLDALGTSVTSVVQLIDAALKERQYNLANQLTKSLQARMMGKKVKSSGYDLVLTFAEHFQGELVSNSVEDAVLHRLYSLGWDMMSDNVSLPIEAAVLHGSWSLYNHFKVEAAVTNLGPLLYCRYTDDCLVICSTQEEINRCFELLDTQSEYIKFTREKPKEDWLPFLHVQISLSENGYITKCLDEPLSLPLPYDLTEVSLSSLPPISWACALGQAELVSKFRTAGANVNAVDLEGRTPLMIALLANKDSAVELELTRSDQSGRNIMHYMVEPFHWENVQLLEKLHVAAPTIIKQLLQQRTKSGCTPVDIAINTKQRTMATAMKRILNAGNLAKKAAVLNGVQVGDLPDVSGLVCNYNVDEDSKLFLARWRAEHEVVDATSIPRPSALSGYRDTAELVYCPITHQYMAAVLNKTDLNYGRYGFHNFYCIELMKRRDTDLWIMFTNWGRIGDGRGEYQTTPFSTFEAAVKEFKSVWRSKSGQEWAPFDQFVVLPKKYRLLESTKRFNNLGEISLPWTTVPEKNLTRKTIQDISNPQKLKSYAQMVNFSGTITNLDRSMACPLGHVTEAAIERARAVLDECEKSAQDLAKLLAKEGHGDADVLRMYERCRELSSELYYNLPVGDFEYGSMIVFDNVSLIKDTPGFCKVAVVDSDVV